MSFRNHVAGCRHSLPPLYSTLSCQNKKGLRNGAYIIWLTSHSLHASLPTNFTYDTVIMKTRYHGLTSPDLLPAVTCYCSSVLPTLRTPSRWTNAFATKWAGGKRFGLVDSGKRGDAAGFKGRRERKALPFTGLVSVASMSIHGVY
jgi:hypothetical protein